MATMPSLGERAGLAEREESAGSGDAVGGLARLRREVGSAVGRLGGLEARVRGAVGGPDALGDGQAFGETFKAGAVVGDMEGGGAGGWAWGRGGRPVDRRPPSHRVCRRSALATQCKSIRPR